MKKLSLPTLFLLFHTCLSAACHFLPDNGSSRQCLLLDFDVPDTDIVDLSQASVIAEYSMKCQIYGDSLICLQSLGSNEWLIDRGASIWRAGWNDRITQRRLDHPMPFLPENTCQTETADTLTISCLDFPPERRPVSAVTSSVHGCKFVTVYGDTMICPVSIREDWNEILSDGTELHRIARRWHEDGQAVPSVWCETLSVGAMSWTVTYVPSPFDAGRPRRSPEKHDDRHYDDGNRIPDGLSVRLYDIHGRLLLNVEGPLTDYSLLPAGVYIIETVCDGGSTVTKVWVK